MTHYIAGNDASPGVRHALIVPSNTDDLPVQPRSIYCMVAGNAVLRDQAGVDLTYALTAGQILPFRPVRVLATGTTATLVAWM